MMCEETSYLLALVYPSFPRCLSDAPRAFPSLSLLVPSLPLPSSPYPLLPLPIFKVHPSPPSPPSLPKLCPRPSQVKREMERLHSALQLETDKRVRQAEERIDEVREDIAKKSECTVPRVLSSPAATPDRTRIQPLDPHTDLDAA